jgi:hypothetical protein
MVTPSRGIQGGIAMFLSSLRRKFRRDVAAPRFLTRLPDELAFLTLEAGPRAATLDEIPSETTPGERRLLYTFFRHFWSGRGAVIEVGPFLGGTTRAIAWGMLENPRREDASRLLTFDRFRGYYSGESLRAFAQRLVDAQIVTSDQLASVADGDFLALFQLLHADQPYSDLIVPINRPLPDRPGEPGEQWLALPDDCRTEGVFVDGCKSWYGTKYFMQAACPVAAPGAFFLFQDYGWYTCFWVSAFLARMGDAVRLLAFRDATYAFQLTRPLSAVEIDERFPDSPTALSAAEFRRLFGALIAGAQGRNDRHAMAMHTLHLAAALATLGDLSAAIEIIEGLAQEDWTSPWQGNIAAARRSPTYTPDGPIRLPE